MTAEILELDVTQPSHFDRVAHELEQRWGGLDGALHAVAFAPRAALAGAFLDADQGAVDRAFAASTYSYAALARLLAALAPSTGGALVGLDFDAAGAWPVYNWMGVCKAALESASRYVARDLGPAGIRSNLIAAGPLHTRAAGGIPEFERLTSAWDARSPMRWDPTDNQPVADASVLPAVRHGPRHHRRDPPCGRWLPRHGGQPPLSPTSGARSCRRRPARGTVGSVTQSPPATASIESGAEERA